MSAASPQRTKIFISYSHKDDKWQQRVRVHLKPLERHFGIAVWADTDMQPGANWREEIKNAIAASRVAVLLISADFMASDFIANDELPPLLNAARNDGAVILPLVLKASSFSDDPNLAQFQAVNDVGRPLIRVSVGEREETFYKLFRKIKSIFVEPAAPSEAPPVLSEESTEQPKPASTPEVESGRETSREFPEPKFLAEFVLDAQGVPKTFGTGYDNYEIRLFIKDAPPDTSKVNYELHETYFQRNREVPRSKRDFEEHITSYGDYIVNITLSGDRETKISDWLTRALENFYGDNASDEITAAIQTLEEN